MQLQVLSAATVTYMPSEWSCKATSMTTVPCCNCCQALMWSMLGLKEWCSKGLWDSCCDELAGHGMQAAVMQHDGNVMQSCSCSMYVNMVNIFHKSATPSHCSSVSSRSDQEKLSSHAVVAGPTAMLSRSHNRGYGLCNNTSWVGQLLLFHDY